MALTRLEWNSTNCEYSSGFLRYIGADNPPTYIQPTEWPTDGRTNKYLYCPADNVGRYFAIKGADGSVIPTTGHPFKGKVGIRMGYVLGSSTVYVMFFSSTVGGGGNYISLVANSNTTMLVQVNGFTIDTLTTDDDKWYDLIWNLRYDEGPAYYIDIKVKDNATGTTIHTSTGNVLHYGSTMTHGYWSLQLHGVSGNYDNSIDGLRWKVY